MFDGLRQRLLRRQEKLLGNFAPPQATATLAPGVREQVEALRREGNACLAAGDMDGAEQKFRAALALDASDPPCWTCLGYVLREKGDLSAARVALRKAIDSPRVDPEIHDAHYLLGQISEQQGDADDALRHYRTALQLYPGFTRACQDICRIYQQRGEMERLQETLTRCVRQAPEVPDYHLWLGEYFVERADYLQAIEPLRAAVERKAGGAAALLALGSVLCRADRPAEGEPYLAQAVQHDASLEYMMHFELGCHLTTSGDVTLGLDHLQRAVALRPDFITAHSTRLMTLSHVCEPTDSAYGEALQAFALAARRHVDAARLRPLSGSGDDSVARRLRIGFVSSDLHQHPVGLFLCDVLRHMDRQSFEVMVYSHTTEHDEMTVALRGLSDAWHDIRGLADDATADLIAAHRVDILIDLNGHTGSGRLPVFARRPARTQVTWLGYWATTGLDEIDFLLADPYSVPVSSVEPFSERVYRLPATRLCMSVPQTTRALDVSPSPALARGHVTFGSYQQLRKITPDVLGVWKRVLDAVPGSVLRLQTRHLSIPEARAALQAQMRETGIDLARVVMLPAWGMDDYLASHAEVDILLDTFPYAGGTTTALGLWMGVPTVTLEGDSMIARQGAAMLQCVGLGDWVARHHDDYVAIARVMAGDPARLDDLRQTLRARTLQSPLFDAKTFASDLGAALRDMHAQTAGRPQWTLPDAV